MEINLNNTMKPIYFKIIFVVIVALFAVTLLSKNIFIVNTPRLNPSFISFIKNFPRMIVSLPKKIYDSISQQNNLASNPAVNKQSKTTAKGLRKLDQKTVDALVSKIPLQQVAQGVYAGEDRVNGVRVIQMDEKSQWTLTKEQQPDGTIITVIKLKK